MKNDESTPTTGARGDTPNNDEQRQGGTTPYADVTQQQWEDDLDAHSLDEAEAREQFEDTEVAEGEDDDISG